MSPFSPRITLIIDWCYIHIKCDTFSCPIHVPLFIIIINMLRFRVLSCLIFTPNVTFLISWCPIHVPCIWYIFMSHSCPRYYNNFKLLNISCPFMSPFFTWYDIKNDIWQHLMSYSCPMVPKQMFFVIFCCPIHVPTNNYCIYLITYYMSHSCHKVISCYH